MRLILWALGSVFAAIAVVQLAIEGMLAVFGGSWTRLLSIGDVVSLFGGPGAGASLPAVMASAPPWIPALIIGALLMYWGRFRRASTPFD
jgi:hypothetical protein